MSTTKPIRGDKGQFKGSMPSVIPLPPSPAPDRAQVIETVSAFPAIGTPEVYDAFRSRTPTPEWATQAPFPVINSVIGQNEMFRVDYEVEDTSRIVGDRDKPILAKREKVDLFIKAQEVFRQEGAPGNWRAVYVYPTYADADGTCLATEVRRGDFGASSSLGVYTPEGEFLGGGSFSEYLKERIGEPGCPLYGETDGYIDDWQCHLKVSDDYTVSGVHISAVCEEVEVDDSYLEDPDAAWDSRFD
jgi:hypothetical protein